MNINGAFPSKWLKAADIADDTTLEIAGVDMEDVAGDGEAKPVVYFTGSDKGLVLNKTNSTAIAGLYGVETEDWVGKAVTLFPTQTEFQGKPVECIRVRLKKPAGAAVTDDLPF
jgi:hypothetical protein